MRYNTRVNLALVAYAIVGASVVALASVRFNLWVGGLTCLAVAATLAVAFPRLYNPSRRST